MKLDLKNIMQTNAHSIDENSAKEIAKNLRKLLGSKPIPKEAIASILPDEAAMVKLFKDYNLFNAALAKQDGYDKNEITRIDVSLFYTTEVKVPYDGIFAKTKKQKQDWVAKYQFNFVKAKNRSINK